MSLIKKSASIILVAAISLSLLSSCATTSETTTPLSMLITDQLNREVTLETLNPQRIVSLAPSNTEIIFALGLGNRLVGRTDYCNYPAEVTEKTSIGSFSEPDIEKIVALEPDLVLADSIQELEVIPQLEELGLTVVALAPDNFEEVFQGIELIGKATGTEENATELLGEMRSRIKAITEKTDSLTENEIVGVFYLVWHEPLMTSGADTLIAEMIEMSGGITIFPEILGVVGTVDLEELIDRNPQVIIAATGMGISVETTMDFFNTETRLNDIDAMKNSRVYGVHMDISGRTGPRIVEGLEEFARAIHPELFDMD